MNHEDWYNRFQLMLDYQTQLGEASVTMRFTRRELVELRNAMALLRDLEAGKV